MAVPEDKLMELMRGPRSGGGGNPSGLSMPSGNIPSAGGMSDGKLPQWLPQCLRLNPRWGQKKLP